MKNCIIFRNLRKFPKKTDPTKTYTVLDYAQERRTKDNVVYFKEETMFVSDDVYKKLLDKKFVYGDVCMPTLQQGGIGQRPTLIDLDVIAKSVYEIEEE